MKIDKKASNIRIKNLARKIKEKDITITDVPREVKIDSYQCFRVGFERDRFGKVNFCQKRRQIKGDIARTILFNAKKTHKSPFCMSGLEGEDIPVNVKNIIFANNYIKLYKLGFHGFMYEARVKYE